MINTPIDLAACMNIDLHNIKNVWSIFQLNLGKPFNTEAMTQLFAHLPEKEKEFLMYLGLNAISTEMEKGGMG